MAASSAIEWTDATWNPVTGCTKVSEGCAHCYAERMARRLQAMGQPNYANGFAVTTHEHALRLPGTWKRPCRVFVNSMGDLFHEEVPQEFIRRVFATMERAPQHRYQILTKRSGRLAELGPSLPWPDHVWMGVTVESARHVDRIEDLSRCGAAVKFVSFEPLLGPVEDAPLTSVDWAIVGGESGPGARPMETDWVLSLRDQCMQAGVPFFFKQWGGVNKKKAGRVLDGRTWDAMPAACRGPQACHRTHEHAG